MRTSWETSSNEPAGYKPCVPLCDTSTFGGIPCIVAIRSTSRDVFRCHIDSRDVFGAGVVLLSGEMRAPTSDFRGPLDPERGFTPRLHNAAMMWSRTTSHTTCPPHVVFCAERVFRSRVATSQDPPAPVQYARCFFRKSPCCLWVHHHSM